MRASRRVLRRVPALSTCAVWLVWLLGLVGSAAAAPVSAQAGVASGSVEEVEAGRVAVPGGQLAYRVFGVGDPLLVINGGPGWSSDHMVPVAERLARGRRVILFDQRGTGSSRVMPLDSTTITLGRMLEDVERLREHLELESWAVLGHSFGGMLAMAYVGAHPQRVRSLVLSAPGGPDLSFLSYYQTSLLDRVPLEGREAAARWSDPARAAESPGRAGYEVIRALLPAYIVRDDAAAAMLAVLDTTTLTPATSQLVWQDLVRIGYDVSGGLGRYDGRVLVIQGRQDALGDHLPHETAALFQDAELVMVEDAAHIIWVDRPDVYYPTIDDFLGRG